MSLKFTIEKLRQQPSRMTKRIREQGLGTFVHWSLYQLKFRRRERKLGIDTLEHAYGINVWGKNGGQYYDPIDYNCLDLILDYMDPNPAKDVFIDYGCGLGRPIIAAAHRPFKRVIGVENNEVCLDLCRKHVASAQRKGKFRCPVEIVETNAEDYELPNDVTKILMYNPFVEQKMMDQVLARIERSLQQHPREIDLVYAPLHKYSHFLDNCQFLEHVKDLPTVFWDHVSIKAYKNKL
ncbi:MAG: methyltransferase domain-containing protein [Pirellulaceae bacterium]|nr:methyltransferase domain-containing protein [Pirellulaceae bacterium]